MKNLITIGTTRNVIVNEKSVLKICKNGYTNENKKEYNNYCLYKDSEIKIVNDILKYNEEDSTLECRKCRSLSEYIVANKILPDNEKLKKEFDLENKSYLKNYFYTVFLDEILLFDFKSLGKKLKYEEKRDYIINHTKLSFDEMQLPENWGINDDNEFVLIDYSI